MLFLGPLYSFLASRYATSINHFALVRLCWLLLIRKRRSVQSEFGVWLFAFYFILVLMLTTFRYTYFPWELNFHWDRSLDNVNFVFLKNTWKMIYAPSKVDFTIIPWEIFWPLCLLVSWSPTFCGKSLLLAGTDQRDAKLNFDRNFTIFTFNRSERCR